MAEVLFIFIILYITYVIHHNALKNKHKKVSNILVQPIPTPIIEQKPKITEKVIVKQQSVVKKDKPIPKTIKMPIGNLRDPKTGEAAKIASSYRMLRRWIKEALVAEGLVDKIYKTNELNTTTLRKINKALNTLKKMKKYQ